MRPLITTPRRAGRAAPAALLALLLALSAWLYRDSIGLYPSFKHAWAQADWLALALQFRARGYDFWHPATFNLLTDDGVTAAGFPVPAYLTALLMGLTGSEAPGLMRGLTLALSLGGLLALFGLVRRTSGSAAKGGLVALFAFSSPIYVYNQAGFQPSVPALAAVFAGYYWFGRALEAPLAPAAARRRLAAAVAWLALAGAMRTPLALPLLCTLGHVVVLRSRRTAATVGWGAVGAIYGVALAADIAYNQHLSRAYHGALFLARPLPFVSWANAVQVTKTVREYWLWCLLSKPQWLLFALAGLVLCVRRGGRWLRCEWAGHWLALGAGGVLYYGLMGQQFSINDYYLLDSFYLPLVLGFAACVVAWPPLRSGPARRVAAAAAAALSAGGVWSARVEQQRRVSAPPTDYTVFTRDNFRPSARWLDSLGVPRAAKLLVLDAYSCNLPLLLAHRRGWTMLKYRDSPLNLTPGNLRRALARPGADYVVTQNVTYGPEVVNVFPAIAARLRPVANNGHLTLWRIRPVPLASRWRLRTDFEGLLDTAAWAQVASVSAGSSASGRRAARLAGPPGAGLAYHRSVAALGLRAGQQLLVAARYRTSPDAGAELMASLSPRRGGAPYWQRAVPCRFTRPENWEPVGAAFALPAPRAPDDVLRVALCKSGPGEIALDDLELTLLAADAPARPAAGLGAGRGMGSFALSFPHFTPEYAPWPPTAHSR